MWGHPGNMDFPGAKLDKEQDVIRDQPTQRPHLRSEEVGGDEHMHVRADELLPRGGRLPFWGWWDAMPLQNIAHRLITDGIAEVCQDANDPVIAPGAILLGQAYDQGLQLGAIQRKQWCRLL